MSEITTEPKRVRFGNWMPTTTARIAGLTLVGWGALLGGLLLMMIGMSQGYWLFGLAALAAGLLFNLIFVLKFGGDVVGRTIAQSVAQAVSGASRVNRGSARYRTGSFSNLPGDKLTALPGVLADLEEFDGTDGRGTPFTLLYSPSVHTITAVFACHPDGIGLEAQHKVDYEVSVYGGWLAAQAKDSAIAGATVTVDSALRSSAPLVQKIADDVDPDAPAIARLSLMESAHGLPAKYAEASTWVTITWLVPALAVDVEDAVAEVASALPFHQDGLRNAGGGFVIPATSEMLADSVRIAYRPDRSTEIASDALRGLTSGLRVTEAGPDYFDDDNLRVCFHDGVASITALVMEPPRLLITEDTLRPVFDPQDRFLRKRTTVFYRPLAPETTVQIAERMGKMASTSATAKGRTTMTDRRAMRHAEKIEAEVVEGAGMTRFSMHVTVTFDPTERAYRDATVKLKQLLGSASLKYRLVDYENGAAFHSTLPLGILPWLYEAKVDTALGMVA